MRFRVTLGIGFANGEQEDEIDIDDDDLDACETDEEREELIWEYWQEWANNYIDGGISPVEGDV